MKSLCAAKARAQLVECLWHTAQARLVEWWWQTAQARLVEWWWQTVHPPSFRRHNINNSQTVYLWAAHVLNHLIHPGVLVFILHSFFKLLPLIFNLLIVLRRSNWSSYRDCFGWWSHSTSSFLWPFTPILLSSLETFPFWSSRNFLLLWAKKKKEKRKIVVTKIFKNTESKSKGPKTTFELSTVNFLASLLQCHVMLTVCRRCCILCRWPNEY